MGLDAIEILMKVEEAFNISITDAEATKTPTPRALIDLVMSKVGQADCASCLTQRAFHRFRASIIRKAGFKRDQIRPDVFMETLFPFENRKELLAQILRDAGLTATPELGRPRWLLNLLAVTGATIGIMTAVASLHLLPKSPLIDPVLIMVPVFFGIFAAILATGFLALATRKSGRDFKPAMATVGGFSRWMVANSPEIASAPAGNWSRELVAIKIREILVDSLNCEKNYHEDANIIKDLGLG